MEDKDSQLGVEVERHGRRIEQLEARVQLLEASVRRVGVATDAERRSLDGEVGGDTAASDVAPPPNPWMIGLPALVGRTIMVLGGAFFLRALTESGAIPLTAGVAVAFAYALAWLGVADRAARSGRLPDATGHGLAATLVAFPLIWEASTRFGLMGPAVSALTLAVATAATLGLAWLRNLELLAWIATLASTTTGVALLFATRSLPIFSVALFAMAAASLAASFHRDWYGLRWPAAIAIDTLVVLAMYLIGKPNHEWLRAGEVAIVQLLLATTYLGIIGVRTIVLGHPTREFGIVQSLLALGVGFEGARRVLGPGHAWAGVFPLAALILTVVAYAAAFLRFERDPEQRANWNWYVTLGTILAIYAGLLFALGDSVGLWWAGLATVAAFLGTRHDRAAVRWSSLAFALASAFGSGLLAAAHRAFLTADLDHWLVFPASAWGTAILCMAAWIVSRRGGDLSAEPYDRVLPGLALLVVATVGVGAGAVAFLARGVAVLGEAAPSPAGLLAVMRTAVIVAVALALAATSRLWGRQEVVWTAYGALATAAFKILLDDLPNGTAMTIFMSFVLFGAALILAPRMVPENAGR